MATKGRWGYATSFPAVAIDDKRLSHMAFRVLALIGNYGNMHHSGFCWELQSILAKRLGVTQQAVSKAIGELRAYGYIKVAYYHFSTEGNRRRAKYQIQPYVKVPYEHWRFVPDSFMEPEELEEAGYVPFGEDDETTPQQARAIRPRTTSSRTTNSRTTAEVVIVNNKSYDINSNELISVDDDDADLVAPREMEPERKRQAPVGDMDFNWTLDNKPPAPDGSNLAQASKKKAPARKGGRPEGSVGGKRTPKPSFDGRNPKEWVDEFCKAVYTDRGLKYPANFHRQIIHLQDLRTRYSLEDVLACWAHLKQQRRWQDQDIPYSVLVSSMVEWEGRNGKSATRDNRYATDLEFDDDPAHLSYVDTTLRPPLPNVRGRGLDNRTGR